MLHPRGGDFCNDFYLARVGRVLLIARLPYWAFFSAPTFPLRLPLPQAGRTEAALAALGGVELVDLHKLDGGHALHHELRHALTAGDGDGLVGVGVDGDDLELAAIA